MKIDTTLVLKMFDGSSYINNDIELTLGYAVAKALSTNQTSKDPLRDTVLAMDFYKNPILEINEADLQYVKDVLVNSQVWFPGAKGAIFLAFEGAKNTTDKTDGVKEKKA